MHVEGFAIRTSELQRSEAYQYCGVNTTLRYLGRVLSLNLLGQCQGGASELCKQGEPFRHGHTSHTLKLRAEAKLWHEIVQQFEDDLVLNSTVVGAGVGRLVAVYTVLGCKPGTMLTSEDYIPLIKIKMLREHAVGQARILEHILKGKD